MSLLLALGDVFGLVGMLVVGVGCCSFALFVIVVGVCRYCMCCFRVLFVTVVYYCLVFVFLCISLLFVILLSLRVVVFVRGVVVVSWCFCRCFVFN